MHLWETGQPQGEEQWMGTELHTFQLRMWEGQPRRLQKPRTHGQQADHKGEPLTGEYWRLYPGHWSGCRHMLQGQILEHQQQGAPDCRDECRQEHTRVKCT